MIKKVNSFSYGIIALMFSQVVIKIFGLIFSIYLINKEGFGDNGNAIYMSGYQVYALFLTISSIGIPNAISKMISENIADGDYMYAKKILKVSIVFFAIIGFIETIILHTMAKFIAEEIILISEVRKILIILSPAIFFVSVSSVLKGFFNGINKISVTARMQVIEQIVKTFLTIFLVEIISYIFQKNIEIMAVGVSLAITLSSMFSFIYAVIKYKKLRIYDYAKIGYKRYEKNMRIYRILKEILNISIPISLSALVASINKNIDSITIVRILGPLIGVENAKAKYGILSSKIDTLIAMPLAFNLSIATALIPEVAKNMINNKKNILEERIKTSLALTVLIGLPCTFGMFLYSKQILELLFPNASDGGTLLAISSFSIIFATLTQTINGILQGIGKTKIPFIALLIGSIVKLVLNILLIRISGIYEKGAVISNVISSIVVFLIVYRVLRKSIKFNINLYDILLKPWVATIIMCVISYALYLAINSYFSVRISTCTSIASAVIFYIIFVFRNKYLKII